MSNFNTEMVTLDSWSADENQLSLQLPVIENNTLTVVTCWSLRHALVVTLCTTSFNTKTFYVMFCMHLGTNGNYFPVKH